MNRSLRWHMGAEVSLADSSGDLRILSARRHVRRPTEALPVPAHYRYREEELGALGEIVVVASLGEP